MFYDGLNELNKVREQLKYYPYNIWLYIIYIHFRKISESMAFVGRTSYVGYL